MPNPLLFPEYSHLTEVDLVHDTPKKETIYVESEPLLAQIFAPDPQTNLPRSDASIVYSADSNPIISQFVRDNLQRPNGEISSFGHDEDSAQAALEMTRGRYEDTVAYAERLRQTIADYEAREHKE